MLFLLSFYTVEFNSFANYEMFLFLNGLILGKFYQILLKL